MTREEQRLVSKYGTSDREEILKKRTGQVETKDISSNKTLVPNTSETEIKSLCKKAGVEYLEGYEERIVEYTLSDESVDRHGDMMVMAGVQLEHFSKNPVILRFHDSHDFPVGTAIKVWVEGTTLKAWVLFVDDRVDTSGMSERAFRFAKSGIMRAGSIGFRGLELKFPSKEERDILGMRDYGVIFSEWELVEFSIVAVPANPNALAKAFDKGKILSDDLKHLPPDVVEKANVETEEIDMTKEEVESLIQKAVESALAAKETFGKEDEELIEKAGASISKKNKMHLKKLVESLNGIAKAHGDCKNCIKELIGEDEPEEEEEKDFSDEEMESILKGVNGLSELVNK